MNMARDAFLRTNETNAKLVSVKRETDRLKRTIALHTLQRMSLFFEIQHPILTNMASLRAYSVRMAV